MAKKKQPIDVTPKAQESLVNSERIKILQYYAAVNSAERTNPPGRQPSVLKAITLQE